MTQIKKIKGFTLVELAIVLVIIGLLVAGVLAGQTLIEQAKVRRVLAGIEDIDRAWHTFYLKYGDIPGDVKNGDRFFVNTDTEPWNDDGIYEPQENQFAWSELDESGLYPSSPDGTAGNGDEIVWPGDRNVILRIAPNNSALTTPVTFRNKPVIVAYSSHLDDAQVNYKTQAVYTVAEISSIDTKYDDGKPSTGVFLSIRGYDAGHTAIQDCFSNPSPTALTANTEATNTSEYTLSNDNIACRFRLVMPSFK